MVQMTSYFQDNLISLRETFSKIFVKIGHDDVTWRHMTSFLHFVHKKCWRQQKIRIQAGPVPIFQWELYNTYPTRGQTLFCDKRLKRYRIFNICRIFADVSKKMLKSAQIMPESNFLWVNHVKIILNKLQTKFGTKWTKNREVMMGGQLGPLPYIALKKPTRCRIKA